MIKVAATRIPPQHFLDNRFNKPRKDSWDIPPGLWAATTFGVDAELIEVVAEFPQELMVAVRHSSIADLVAAVESDFGTDLHDCAGIEVAHVMIACVPLRGECKAFVHWLFEGKLASRALRGRYHVPREIVATEADPRSTVKDLGELGIKVIAGVVVGLAGGKKYVVSRKE
jgi:hypothetical protein